MIEISSQMREFVNFAQDAVANNAKNTVARLGRQESRFSAFSIGAATDGDSVGKLRRSPDLKRANNSVRTEFRNTVAKMFGGAERIPPSVLEAMNIQDYEKGKPLTADRILDVYAAIKDHIAGLKNAAFEDGTLRAVDVADTAADKFVEKFQAKHGVRLGAAAASNLKRALLLCAANALDDDAVKGGEAAVKKFARSLNSSFKYTLTALGFDAATRMVDVPRIRNLMKDELHMRGAVFALLDKDGNVDVNHFDARLAIFDDAWLTRNSSGLLRPNLDSRGSEAVKALQAEFTRTAKVKVGDLARAEIDAFFEANPDRIPAAIRNDRREVQLYTGLVKQYVVGKGENGAADRLAAGDADAKIDVASALKDFNQFMDSIYASAKGDKDLLRLVEQFSREIAFNSVGEMRSLEDIKKKFIEPVRANLEELRAVAGGNAGILKAGLEAISWNQMKPFKKGVITTLANEAKNWGRKILQSVSERSSAYEIAKEFAGMFAEYKKLMPDANYNDRYDRAEHNAYLKFFTGVAVAGLNEDEKVRMTMIFATDEAKIASNTMQTLEQDGSMDPAVKWDLQDMTYLMRSCTSFLADDLSLDADAFAVNEIIEDMTFDTLPADVAAKFADLLQIK